MSQKAIGTTHFEFTELLQQYPPNETGKYQVLGWMPSTEFETLLRSIQSQRQVQIPIVQDSEGNILDGHHRKLAHDVLKIKDPLKVQTLGNMSDNGKRRYALSVNLVRRQITRKERRLLIATELHEIPETSNTELAEVCGTTKKTIKSVRDELVAKGEIPQIDRTRRRNGGTYPLPQIVTTDERSSKRAQDVMQRLGDDAPPQTLSIENAAWIVRDKKRKELAALPLPKTRPSDVVIEHADFRNLEVESKSIDLLLTDPPYSKEALPMWEEMAEIAASVLKPGGLLVAYSGVGYLPEVYRMLSEHLSYVWTISISLAAGRTFMQRTQGRCGWRPVLLFCNGNYEPKRSFSDTAFGARKEKELHDWQQGIAESRKLIETFSEPNDLVYDPFGGSFTNAAAAYELGRRFIGCDIEENFARIGKQRLAEAMKSNPDEPTKNTI